MDSARQNDLVQRKLSVDALRKRLGDSRTEQEKLRESCEGFESLFIQKMWEQMRKTLPKEGYLHSKDEETYQSMFDVELSKKMASAGGIGLADMLYDQLSQKLTDTARTTTPNGKLAATAAARAQVEVSPPANKLTADNLYSPLEGEEDAEHAALEPLEPEEAASLVDDALSALLAEVGGAAPSGGLTERTLATAGEGTVPDARTPAQGAPDQSMPDRNASGAAVPEQGAAPAAGASDQATADAGVSAPSFEVSLPEMSSEKALSQAQMFSEGAGNAGAPANSPAPHVAGAAGTSTAAMPSATAQAAAEQTAADPAQAARREVSPSSSWHTPARFSAKPKPVSTIGRNGLGRKAASADNAPAQAGQASHRANSLLPVDGTVVKQFGWEEDRATGERQWNPGMAFATAPGAPVRASLAGTVIFAGEREDTGSTIVLEHKDGYRSFYGNVAADGVKVGDAVKAGTNFAKVLASPQHGEKTEDFALFHLAMKRGEMALNPASTMMRMATASK